MDLLERIKSECEFYNKFDKYHPRNLFGLNYWSLPFRIRRAIKKPHKERSLFIFYYQLKTDFKHSDFIYSNLKNEILISGRRRIIQDTMSHIKDGYIFVSGFMSEFFHADIDTYDELLIFDAIIEPHYISQSL